MPTALVDPQASSQPPSTSNYDSYHHTFADDDETISAIGTAHDNGAKRIAFVSYQSHQPYSGHGFSGGLQKAPLDSPPLESAFVVVVGVTDEAPWKFAGTTNDFVGERIWIPVVNGSRISTQITSSRSMALSLGVSDALDAWVHSPGSAFNIAFVRTDNGSAARVGRHLVDLDEAQRFAGGIASRILSSQDEDENTEAPSIVDLIREHLDSPNLRFALELALEQIPAELIPTLISAVGTAVHSRLALFAADAYSFITRALTDARPAMRLGATLALSEVGGLDVIDLLAVAQTTETLGHIRGLQGRILLRLRER